MPEPKQVTAARKMVEEAEEQFKSQKDGSEEKNPEPTVTEPAATTVTPPVEDKNVLDWENEYKQLLDKHGKLESRFNVMKGKYDSEVPVLHGEIRVLKAENEQLKANKTNEETPFTTNSDISQENITQLYGQELVDYLAAKDQDAKTKIEELEKKVSEFDKHQQDDAENRFYGALTEAHPNWRELNTTAAFIGFLEEYLPSVGMTRQQIVDNAGAVGNPDPIIGQLTEFKKHTSQGSSISSQVVPEDGGGSPTPVDTTKRTIPESEVANFYKAAGIQISQGKNPQMTEEYKRLDREYAVAAREGRIVVGQ